METVQLQCGYCQKMMAINIAHLGSQVQCPHCRGVVQTPPPKPTTAPAPAPPPVTTAQTTEADSIFANPETSDDVISSNVPRRLERPPATIEEPPPIKKFEPAASPTVDAPGRQEPENDLASFKPRRVYDKSMASAIAFIFLIPYAILTTLMIIYLLFQTQNRPHPLDMMPDPAPAKDKGKRPNPGRVEYNYPLAPHQRTVLLKPIQLGDLLVNPRRLLLTKGGDLQLVLRVKNVSPNTSFAPVHQEYLRYSPSNDDETKPYTFLESKSAEMTPLFGGSWSYPQREEGESARASDYLNPKEEVTILITTEGSGLEERKQLYDKQIQTIVDSNQQEYVWRVRLCRGFVKYRGKNVSTTAVFGVEFTAAQIKHDS
jgi:hypothetical protein